MNLKEVIALITLLDDPDDGIYSEVKNRFIILGPPAIPHLETAWENSFDALMQKRIEGIIHTIQFKALQNALKFWAENEQDDLFRGCAIIARYQYPDLDENKLKKQLHQIKQDVWLELHDDLTAVEKVKIINHILFEVHQFGGNITNYHAPQNSFINVVLETKKGNPVMLSVIYALICKELAIPIYGINLPQHFVLAYVNDFANLIDPSDRTLSDNILFYVNPFSKGLIFNQSDIDQFLNELMMDELTVEHEIVNGVASALNLFEEGAINELSKVELLPFDLKCGCFRYFTYNLEMKDGGYLYLILIYEDLIIIDYFLR